jgi:hypothetical protein
MTAPHVRRRRRSALAVLAVVALLAGVAIGSGAGDDDPPTGTARTEPPAPAELPGGGRSIFPGHRIVALYGHPRAEALGALGIGKPDAAGRKLLRLARRYDSRNRPAIPAMELLATIAESAPGREARYSSRTDRATIDRYLAAARRIGALLILDIQPGRSRWRDEIDRLTPWLAEPDVGLALDPEWSVGPGQVPGQVIGSMDARTINATAAYLAKLVLERDLPQKLLLIHRFTPDGIARNSVLRTQRGVALVVNVDGFGAAADKIAKYHELTALNPGVAHGFKLFFEEDRRNGQALMTTTQVRALRPRPSVVVYE